MNSKHYVCPTVIRDPKLWRATTHFVQYEMLNARRENKKRVDVTNMNTTCNV